MTLEFAADQAFQDFVIDAGEVFFEIALQDVAMGAGKVGEAFECPVGAKANPIGVGVGNEGALEGGHDDVAEGVMDHSIAVGGGGDHPGFGFHDAEGAIGSGLVGFGVQFVLELGKFAF